MAGESGAPRLRPQAAGRRAGESKRARLREGPEPAQLGPPRPPEKMEAAPGPVTGRGRAGGSRAGVRAASWAGPGVTHGAGPSGSLSASASSPSPSSAAAASGCSLGPRGAAPVLGPSVVFRLLRLPATGSRGGGGGCAGGRRPKGSRGGRRTAAFDRSGCGCGCCCCCCRTRRRLCLRLPPVPRRSVSPRPRRSPLPARARL